MRKCSAKTEQDGLFHRPTHGDDECGHHRLRVAWLQTVQSSQDDGGGNEKPRAGVALLEELIEIRHPESYTPPPHINNLSLRID